MQNFEFYCPTRVVFGKDTEQEAGRLVRAHGCKKALVHYGSKSAEQSGLLARIVKSLTEAGVGYVLLGGVQPNPKLSLVREGVGLCLGEGVDFVLAVGGGSVIDSAKGIAMGAFEKQPDVWRYYLKQEAPTGALPVGAVLTIAAAGSETSATSVVTNEDGLIKRSATFEFLIPRFALMNPELTATLPPYQTACGVTDILMHTIDRYFGCGEPNEMTDAIAEGLMRVVAKNGDIAMRSPGHYTARSELMWAGSLSHNRLTGLGRPSDFSVHQLGHELSGMFDAAHGATLAAVFGSWARYVCHADLARFARFGRKVWGIAVDDINQAALMGIAATEAYFMSIGMPVSVPQLIGRTLTEAEIDELAYKCSFFGRRTVGVFCPIDQLDMRNIYKMANARD